MSSAAVRVLSDDQRLVVIQRNPVSGSGRGRTELRTLITELRRMNFRVRMFGRRPDLDTFLKRPEVSTGLRCLVAAGGDGTIADLTNRQHGVPIAVLPLGTENLLARCFGIPLCGRRVAQLIAAGRVRTLDSGLAGARRFLLMLSAGVDASIVWQLHAVRTGHIQYTSYVGPIIRGLGGYLPRPIRVTTPEHSRELTGTHVLVTNVPAYGFGFRFSPDAIPDDGLLDVRVFHGNTRVSTLYHALHVRSGLPGADEHVTRFLTRSLTLEAADAGIEIPVQVDGDPAPGLPSQIRIDPASLHLVVH